MFNRAEFKKDAKAVLSKNYWTCFLVTLVPLLLNGSQMDYKIDSSFDYAMNGNYVDGVSSFFGNSLIGRLLPYMIIAVLLMLLAIVAAILFSLLVVNILEVGKKKFFLDAREGKYEFKTLGFVYKSSGFWNVAKIVFVQNLLIFLWTLLLIVPGVIAYYRYYFVKYIVAENPNIEMSEAFALSRELTNGIKMDLFILNLSFIGWNLLNIITFGLATFFIAPYMEATDAQVYYAYRNHMGRVY